ncbi:uncharacterized protein LOC134274128 [Saccostrea cucullata]|uniref:uncharacterized protein LOC134274128 n=1 Tax=Saccostrea cuccullata TaxID=36930 RepID=UPI002ECFCA13
MQIYHSSSILQSHAQDYRETNWSADKTSTDESGVVYSKPEKKKCHNTKQESDMSLELLCQDVSDGEDVFDSDEFDDETDVINSVEHSVNTFISTADKKQT